MVVNESVTFIGRKHTFSQPLIHFSIFEERRLLIDWNDIPSSNDSRGKQIKDFKVTRVLINYILGGTGLSPESWLWSHVCHLQTVWPWSGHFPYLNLGFFTSKTHLHRAWNSTDSTSKDPLGTQFGSLPNFRSQTQRRFWSYSRKSAKKSKQLPSPSGDDKFLTCPEGKAWWILVLC